MRVKRHKYQRSGRHARHEHGGKMILDRVADFLGEVHHERGVPAQDGMRIDSWFRRLHPLGSLPGFVALWGQMLPADSMIELYSRTLRVPDLLACHCKQMVWHAHLLHQARRRKAADPPADHPAVAVPMLWMTSTGRPDRVLRDNPFVEAPGLSRGLYVLQASFPMGIVVLAELPQGKRTLLMRLMGDAKVKTAAMVELLAMPDHEPDKAPLVAMLASLLRAEEHGMNESYSAGIEAAVMSETWAEIQRHEQMLVEQGIEQGIEQGAAQVLDPLRGAVEQALVPHLGRLNNAQRSALYNCTDSVELALVLAKARQAGDRQAALAALAGLAKGRRPRHSTRK